MHFTWLSLEVTTVCMSHVLFSNQERDVCKSVFLKRVMACTSQWMPFSGHIFTYTHTHTISHPLIYPTRIQLLNSASGSIASWLHHLANPPVISSNSLHPLGSNTHRVPLLTPYKNLIKWKPWCPSCIPWANEYQWETCFTDIFLCGLISLL